MGSLLDKCREIEDDTREEIARIEQLPATHPDKARVPELTAKVSAMNSARLTTPNLKVW
ncbi:MAG: hypothetical protein IM631_12795 [Cytophagales bacterium]|nr:hypothetical protein [Cytophagales bacterium]MCA6372250.1 hypothetical protein [Cytophagales bacterium]MCA6382395.1 hypothetical protein [Cytophagales bacterium]